MPKLVPEHIDEAIKHMPGRPDEEIWGFLKQDSWKYNVNDEHMMFDLYHKLIQERPYIKIILEDILGTSPQNYRIQQINKNPWSARETNFVFYFEQHSSFMLTFNNKPETAELLLKHRVNIQLPGNSDYSFSVTMYDEKIPQAPVDNIVREYDPKKKRSKKM